MRDIAMAAANGIGVFAGVARIGTQVLCHGFGDVGLISDLAVQHRLQLTDIVAISANQREAERHSLLIHQQMPPGAVLSRFVGFLPTPSSPIGASNLGAVNSLPAPLMLIVNRNASRSQRLEESGLAPFLKIAVYRTAGPECLGQRLPLDRGAQHKHDPCEYLPWLQRLAATPGLPLVLLLAASLALRNQWSGPGPQLIRHFPRLPALTDFMHDPSKSMPSPPTMVKILFAARF